MRQGRNLDRGEDRHQDDPALAQSLPAAELGDDRRRAVPDPDGAPARGELVLDSETPVPLVEVGLPISMVISSVRQTHQVWLLTPLAVPELALL